MLGTTTNDKGEFSIPAEEGNYQLIVSYLGFKTITYNLDTKTYNKPLVFALVEDENLLDEIIIQNTKYDQRWEQNLVSFKKEFIGLTTLSKNCEILNPKVLHFEYDWKQDRLTAIAREPLKIMHKGLGYLITYDLDSFIIKGNYVSYLGYRRYKNLKGSKRKQRKWKENRLLSYNGSEIHFYKSVINNKIKQEGYIVDLIKRIPNKERPSEENIKKAQKLVALSNSFFKFSSSSNFSMKIDTPKTALDSALIVLRKAELPKYTDFLYKSNIAVNEIISIRNNIMYLDFQDFISVTYTKEKEEEGFLSRISASKKREASFQNSYIIPLKHKPIIDSKGLLLSPLDVLYEGYWSYEKFANSLPLDYLPASSKSVDSKQ
jgi:hypothetical protein